MPRSIRFTVVLSIASLTGAFSAYASSYSFTDIQPSATAQTSSANSINNAGTIVGGYREGNKDYGFEYSGGTYTTLSFPNTNTYLPAATGINNSGQYLYHVPASVFLGGSTILLVSGNTTVPIQYPNTPNTVYGWGMNDAGEVVGRAALYKGSSAAFLYSNGTVSNIGGQALSAYGINNAGQIVGSSAVVSQPGHPELPIYSGYLYQNGNFTTLNFPGAGDTQPFAINNLGEIVGFYVFTENGSFVGPDHGFIYENGEFTEFDVPGATSTTPTGVNDKGQIVGSYDRNGETIGFLADPVTTPEPASLNYVVAALLAAWIISRRGQTGRNTRNSRVL